MRYLLIPLLVLFSPLSWSEVDFGDKNCPGKYGAKLVSLQGKLLFNATRNGQWQVAQLNQILCEGSRVQVEANSRASIMLSNGIVLRLDAGTVLSLDGISPNETTLLNLLKGFVHFISRTPKLLKISTPIANAGPEGTEFAMRVDDNNASLWVYEGGVKFFNAQGSVHLSPGQGAQAHKGQAPQTKIDIKPQDAVNWALYYPPLLPYPDAKTSIDSELRTAIHDFRQGRVDVALARLDGLSPQQQTPYFFKIRGAMRLTVGQDKLALQDIHALLANKPNDAEALALQSVLALTQNRKDESYALANRAIAANPQSASAYSALSYAEQGRFQLDKAQAAADQAVKLAPHDAMVWARKAELELSQGLTSESKQAAQKALELDASLERTQTVMGFSYLLRMDTDEALQSFKKAIKLDSTSPLARLGLGLAKIRNGDLEEGRQDLEIAAILDPNNSLIRSYLGKAYYEEKRSSLAEDQFGLAKERDPKDPTPYFYNAIEKQTTNRPVEALHDMQKAIELNGNRGVYRSKQTLDDDLAARSAAQGRIYSDLGFSQRALVEGWNSVSADPSNFSAHRFLADSYAALPRHQVARVSELLQSQLLQPTNITPIQPHLAESNLLLINGLGPSSASFNEFNPLFQRNRLGLQTSGLVGSNDSYGDEVVQSGLKDNLSYSLGQFHYQTHGFRANNQLREDIYTGFVQAKVLPNLSVQFEARHRESKFGDLTFNFDLNKPQTAFNKSLNFDLLRAGGHYMPKPNVDILSSIIYLNEREKQKGDGDPTNTQSRGILGEGQAIFRHGSSNVILGGGYFDKNQNDNPGRFSEQHGNAYIYSYIRFPEKFLWTIGASFDSYRKGASKEQFSPKVGLIWKVTDDTSIRGTFFQSIKRPLLNDQTIEPTNIAGFNQIYDDFNGTGTERYGVALGHRINHSAYTGIEASRRILHRPQEGSTLVDEERLFRAYLHWTPRETLAFTANYELEDFRRSNASHFHTVTHIGNMGMRYFHPSGLTSHLQATYVNQSVSTKGHDGFVLIDAGLSYRLPKRYGILSLQINNIFDQKFSYQDQSNRSPQDVVAPRFYPERTLLTRFTLAF
jgi:Flp pilus assembly protein TadD